MRNVYSQYRIPNAEDTARSKRVTPFPLANGSKRARLTVQIAICSVLITVVSAMFPAWASAGTTITLNNVAKAHLCLPASKLTLYAKPVCFNGSTLIASLPAHAKSSSSDLAHCFTYLGIDLVGASLEGAPLDEFAGLGEGLAIADIAREAFDTPGCL
jgi:hypothetical protein